MVLLFEDHPLALEYQHCGHRVLGHLVDYYKEESSDQPHLLYVGGRRQIIEVDEDEEADVDVLIYLGLKHFLFSFLKGISPFGELQYLGPKWSPNLVDVQVWPQELHLLGFLFNCRGHHLFVVILQSRYFFFLFFCFRDGYGRNLHVVVSQVFVHGAVKANRRKVSVALGGLPLVHNVTVGH